MEIIHSKAGFGSYFSKDCKRSLQPGGGKCRENRILFVPLMQSTWIRSAVADIRRRRFGL
jgi:hypothetical protein